MVLSFTRTDYSLNNPYGLAIGDFTGDGLLDLAATNYWDGTISVLVNEGDGTFQTPIGFATSGSGVVTVAVADLNGDGIQDLAATCEVGYNSISIFLGNGDGTFQGGQAIESPLRPHGIVASDLDGDGKSDLIVADFQNNTVSVHLGNGDGTFQSRSLYATGVNPYHIMVEDLNADGNLDVITTNMNNGGSGTVSVLLGAGDGSLQPQMTFEVGLGPWGGDVGDLNGDGKQDLVIANRYGSDISVLLGNGDGTFQTQTLYNIGYASSAVIGDLDGDSKADIAVAVNDTVSILLGNGDGTFQQPENFAVGFNPTWLVIGDFNGDGRPDLATANFNSFTVSVLLNGNLPPTITSNGGGNTASVFVSENLTAVTTLDATDSNAGQTLSYSIAGGADSTLFTINPASGVLAFAHSPDFENPTDADDDSIYSVTVQVSDGAGGTDTQAIDITVENVIGSTITGNNQAQTLTGTGEEDTLSGRGGADTLQGLIGNDFLDGGDGKDTLIGGDGNDTYVVDRTGDIVTESTSGGIDTVQSSVDFSLGANVENLFLIASDNVNGTGNSGGNVIIGNAGNNILIGLGGADTVNGGNGTDTVVGGLGADELTGGAVSDIFDYDTLSESGLGINSDTILDFTHADKIDLSTLDARSNVNGKQAFTFIGTAAFSGVSGQLHFSLAGGDSVVSGDVNGDSIADFSIIVHFTSLTAADFIL